MSPVVSSTLLLVERMRTLLILLIALLVGCGYHTPNNSDIWVGGDARILYLQLFDNQTSEPYLENFLTDALVAELARSRLVELTEDRERADVRLVGEIISFTSNALAYGASDQITDYRATLKVSARLLNTRGDEVLWQRIMQRSEDYLGANNKTLQLEGERLAAREAAKRLAEDIYSSLLNNF